VASGATVDVLSGGSAVQVTIEGLVSMASGGLALDAAINAGGVLSGPGYLEGAITDAGEVLGGEVFGSLVVSSGGRVSGGFVHAGATASVLSGGTASNVSVFAGAGLVLDGGAAYSGGGPVAGALTGTGTLEDLGGALTISSGAGFAGQVVINAGSVTLAGAGGVGSSQIVFSAGATEAELLIGASDTPTAGTTYASDLLDFSSPSEDIDLAGLPYVSGASAAVSGSTLVLTDGGKTYDFALGGTSASSYVVTKDGSGTLITADPPAANSTAQLVQAMATFGATESPGAAIDSSLVSAHVPLIAEPGARAGMSLK
jgi:hypothetical protein